MPPAAASKPTDPTDMRDTDLVAGHITRGGPGPCYGLVTDDGVEYALHGTGIGTLDRGQLRHRCGSPRRSSKVDCGPGTPASIVAR